MTSLYHIKIESIHAAEKAIDELNGKIIPNIPATGTMEGGAAEAAAPPEAEDAFDV